MSAQRRFSGLTFRALGTKARRVVRELVHVERLRDDPLPRERPVAVEQYGHVPGAVDVRVVVLLRPDLPLNDGVHSLQVGRVRHQGEVDLLPGNRWAVERGAEVVLDVSGAWRVRGRVWEWEWLLVRAVKGPVRRRGKSLALVGRTADEVG